MGQWLWLEVVEARNLENHEALDAYCVVRHVGGVTGKAPCRWRSPTVSSTAHPRWKFSLATAVCDPATANGKMEPVGVDSEAVVVEIFTERNFFFDMFPSSEKTGSADGERESVGSRHAGEGEEKHRSEKNHACEEGGDVLMRGMEPVNELSRSYGAMDAPAVCTSNQGGLGDVAGFDNEGRSSVDSSSDSVRSTRSNSSHSSRSSSYCRARRELSPEYVSVANTLPNGGRSTWGDAGDGDSNDDGDLSDNGGAGDVGDACDEDDDDAIGGLEIRLAILKARAIRGITATDGWYKLRGATSGEVRIRTVLCDPHTAHKKGRVERVMSEQLYAHSGQDHYGFRLPVSAALDWVHLRSYEQCREERRVSAWEREFGSGLQFFSFKERQPAETNGRGADNEFACRVKQLAREGIPRHWRQRVYMAMSGAYEKQQHATPPQSYAALVDQVASRESVAFRQIELDIDRTFGHSGTTICTESGRNVLRRVLKAYSMRNPAIGYCQGLNFVVGFLTLALDEESTFWVLSVICEDMYPGYYIPTMADTQTDMLVLKQLIAEELPELDEFTADVGLPLELLGSQWLICLFTTTFPSETVFRIFDCIMTEGSYFVFPVIMAHLRRLSPQLLEVGDFQTVLSTMKDVENTLFDADELIRLAVDEIKRGVTSERIASLRVEHAVSVRDEMQRADRARALNRQLAVVYQIPAFSTPAASLLRFFHEEAEVSTRSDVAFVLTLLCHGLVWLAEHSKHLRR